MTKCRCGCGATVRHWFIAGRDSKLWARCLADNGGDYVKATACYVAIRDGV
jgi:hypothetical protein